MEALVAPMQIMSCSTMRFAQVLTFQMPKKPASLGVACKGVLWVATLAGQGPGQQKLSSEFYVKNASQLWHDSDHNILGLNVASGAIKPKGIVAVFNFPK